MQGGVGGACRHEKFKNHCPKEQYVLEINLFLSSVERVGGTYSVGPIRKN
jgi:hypothetical protein